MNLPFLKLRVADYPWLLFDRWDDSGQAEPSWESVAMDFCDRARGAAAFGIVVIRRKGGMAMLETWNAAGKPVDPPPSATLCASRLLFDAGRTGHDSVESGYAGGVQEALVIDSRVMGLPLGLPLREDGQPLREAFGTAGPRISAAPEAVALLPVLLRGQTLEVALYDKAPAGRLSRPESARDNRRVRVLAVSRRELRVLRGGVEPMVAAAASLAAAVAADYADRDCAVTVAGCRLVAQWPEGGPLFVATAPEYCFSGEFLV